MKGEQELCRIYRERGFDVARIPNSGGLRQKGDITGVPCVHIEAKRQELLNIWKALEQAESEAPPLDIPAVHFRRNRSDWYVALPLEDFIDLLKLREL